MWEQGYQERCHICMPANKLFNTKNKLCNQFEFTVGGENAACCLDPVFLVNIRTGSDHFNQHDYKRVKLRLSSSHVCKLLLEKDPEKVKHFGFQS